MQKTKTLGMLEMYPRNCFFYYADVDFHVNRDVYLS
jgi:hypothetical protein